MGVPTPGLDSVDEAGRIRVSVDSDPSNTAQEKLREAPDLCITADDALCIEPHPTEHAEVMYSLTCLPFQ
jgi:hypothetical protein